MRNDSFINKIRKVVILLFGVFDSSCSAFALSKMVKRSNLGAAFDTWALHKKSLKNVKEEPNQTQIHGSDKTKAYICWEMYCITGQE